MTFLPRENSSYLTCLFVEADQIENVTDKSRNRNMIDPHYLAACFQELLISNINKAQNCNAEIS